jgi:acyl-CoA thioesterase-1
MPSPPKALIIGDSISIGYTPFVAEALGTRAVVAHNEGNGGDSQRVRSSLDAWLAADADAALVQLNCGLHDIRRQRGGSGCQVPLDAYCDNLRNVVARLKATGRRLIWATTTPVIYQRHVSRGFDRYEDDVSAYNGAAAGIMRAAGVAVNDLHAAVVQAGVEECLGSDGVHMTQDGYALLGRVVAYVLRRHLGQRP